MSPTEKKHSIISGSSTLVILGLIILICCLMGLKYPDPIPPEEGVEVNLGNSDMGFGESVEPDASEEAEESAPPTPSTGENVSTQKAPSAAINTTKEQKTQKETKVQPKEAPKTETKKEAETNTKALFPGSKKNNNAGSQGVTQGGGDQGQQGGNPNSNRYDGKPGNGGMGVKVDGIGNRINGKVAAPPKQEYEPGKIAIDVWIDENGNVVKAEWNQKMSNIFKSGAQRDQCIAAVKRTKYTARPGAGTVKGTITFTFENK